MYYLQDQKSDFDRACQDCDLDGDQGHQEEEPG